MAELQTIGIYMLGFVFGFAVGYVWWAPMTHFKFGFLKGLTLGFWRNPK